jgi:hypothetical protein
MTKKEISDLLDKGMPDINPTEKTRKTMIEAGKNPRYLINNVRLATGRFYTTEEFETYKKRVLNTPLP